MKKVFFFILLCYFTQQILSQYQAGDLDVSWDYDGIRHTSMATSTYAIASRLALQADDKVVAVGIYSDGTNHYAGIIRYNTDGSLDTTFSHDGIIDDILANKIEDVAIQTDGKIVVVGSSSNQEITALRFNSNGTLDSTFADDGVFSMLPPNANAGVAYAIAIQTDGKMVLTGVINAFATLRIDENGHLDSTFSTDGIAYLVGLGIGKTVKIQANGKIVVAGYKGGNGFSYDCILAQYNANGTLDSTFGNLGIAGDVGLSGDAYISDIALQADGKIVAVGQAGSELFVLRHQTTGSLDLFFGTYGKFIDTAHVSASGVALQADGKIVVSTRANQYGAICLTPNGVLDSTFSSDGQITLDVSPYNDIVTDIVLQSDGKILLLAHSSNYDFIVARYLSTLNVGILDFDSPTNSAFVYPNPIQTEATLSYSLSEATNIRIVLLNQEGKEICIVSDYAPKMIGEHTESLSLPASLSAGVYKLLICTDKGQSIGISIIKK